MFRTLSKLMFAMAVAVVCMTGSVFAQPAGQQQQYEILTSASVPQMMQQAGYQHQAKTDNMGLYWTATQPQTGKQVNVFPRMQPGHDYAGLIFAKAVPMPVG